MPQPAASTAEATLRVYRLILLRVVLSSLVSLVYQWASVPPLPSLSLSPSLSPWVVALFAGEDLVAEVERSLGLRLSREVVGQGRECRRRLLAALLHRFRLIHRHLVLRLRVRPVRRLRAYWQTKDWRLYVRSSDIVLRAC